MNDDRLTPEERAVIEAAVARCVWSDIPMESDMELLQQNLRRAVHAYRKATAPPEPFEVYADHYRGEWTRGVSRRLEYFDGCKGDIWLCTVTPIERVR